MGTAQETGKSRAYRLALNKRKAIVTLKWTRGASVAVNPGMRVNAHSAQPVQATRKRVLVYLQYLLWSFGDGLHFRRDRGICPDRPFSTSPVRQLWSDVKEIHGSELDFGPSLCPVVWLSALLT